MFSRGFGFFVSRITRCHGPSPALTLTLTPTPVQAKARPEHRFAGRSGQCENKCGSPQNGNSSGALSDTFC